MSIQKSIKCHLHRLIDRNYSIFLTCATKKTRAPSGIKNSSDNGLVNYELCLVSASALSLFDEDSQNIIRNRAASTATNLCSFGNGLDIQNIIL